MSVLPENCPCAPRYPDVGNRVFCHAALSWLRMETAFNFSTLQCAAAILLMDQDSVRLVGLKNRAFVIGRHSMNKKFVARRLDSPPGCTAYRSWCKQERLVRWI